MHPLEKYLRTENNNLPALLIRGGLWMLSTQPALGLTR